MKANELHRHLAAIAKAKMSAHNDGSPGVCLYGAHYMAELLHGLGRPVCLQAGTAMFPRLTPEQDDGKSTTMTHYSYVWSPGEPASIESVLAGNLPEMHVWLGLLDTNEVVDVSTKEIPAHCRLTTGLDWPGIKPPSFVWCHVQELPPGWVYECNRDATLHAAKILWELFRPDYLRPRG